MAVVILPAPARCARSWSGRWSGGEARGPKTGTVIGSAYGGGGWTVRGLDPQKFRLLAHLMQNTYRVVGPPELVRMVREYDPDRLDEARQIIKWYIHRLRKQVKPDLANRATL